MSEALRRYSIGRRLAVWGGLSVAGFLIVIAALRVGCATRASTAADDRLLLASALSIADAIQIADGEIIVDVPAASFSMLAIGKSDRIFHRVSDDRGRIITGYPDLAADLTLPAGRETAFTDTRYLGFPVRVAASRRLITVAGEPRFVTVAVAETRESRAALAAEIRTYAMLPLLVVGVAAIVMIPLSIRQVLRPIAALEPTLQTRDPNDLGAVRLPVLPTEVAPLVETLNHFMERLRHTLERNRDFLAEAAHQIRTPLASVRTMAEVAMSETDPAAARDQIARVHRNAVAAARITNQLLADATVANRLVILNRERLRLDMLVADVVNDAIGFSEGRAIRFDVEEAAEGATVDGDAVALREAVRNLIDNALVYGPADEPIDVTLLREPDGAFAVRVADRGPGIPDDDKARVLRRFERGRGTRVGGSGLGLAIAERSAEAHGGGVVLTDRPGGGLVAALRLAPAAGLEGAA